MDDSKEKYEAYMQAREDVIVDRYNFILDIIGREDLVVDSMGFQHMTPANYEDSWQQEVIAMLEQDGYSVSVNFKVVDGETTSSIKVYKKV